MYSDSITLSVAFVIYVEYLIRVEFILCLMDSCSLNQILSTAIKSIWVKLIVHPRL